MSLGKALLLSIALLVSGCATKAKQTDTFLKSPRSEGATRAEIPSVPFILQDTNHCGPASLAMAMQWAGQNVSANELADKMFTPGAQGTYQADMISAARRSGMTAVPISGLPALIKEVSSGNPVIVFENLGLSWYPQWHYAVVYGYDLDKEEVLMHSGPEQAKRWDMRKFERSWMLGDYWGLVVLPPSRLSASAGELAHTNAAAGLESIGKKAEARQAYSAITSKWPDSLGSRIGLANLAYSERDYREAVSQLEAATRAHPESAQAHHNLAIAQLGLKKKKAAKLSAEKAVMLAPENSKEAYRRNLQDAFN